ncbi:MAG: glycine zipper family protein [bacterium]|nr:glycine zipper family protein [bacterium]
MYKKRLTIGLIAATLVAGCASGMPRPINTTGMNTYDAALTECRYYAATQVDSGASVGSSAVVGAVLGGLLGAMVGNRNDVAFGAALGGMVGAGGGAIASDDAKINLERDCMAQRGY